METLSPIGKFRQRMDKFLNKLDTWANRAQKKELEKFRMKYDLGMKANPRDSLNYFMEGVALYGDQIMVGDDEFFLREEIDVDDEFTVLSGQLKTWWPELDTKKKDYVKAQFKLLLMLGAIATKNEDMRVVINKYRDPSNPMVY